MKKSCVLVMTLLALQCLSVGSAPAQTSIPAGTPVPQPATPDNTPELETGVAPRFAITLAGGGARGAAHIGVLKVLEANGLKPDFVAGSSVGAVIGGLYSAGVPVAEIEQMVRNGELKKAFFPLPIQLEAVKSVPTYVVKRLLFMRPQIALYSGKSLSKLIYKHVPKERRNIENFPTKFAAISTNLLDTRPVWITKGDSGDAVRASASLPFIYRPVTVNKTELVDGGVRENLPTEVADAAGAPLIVAVKLHSTLDAQGSRKFRTVLSYADRVISIMLAEIEGKAVAGASLLIEPDVGDMTLYDFDSESLEKAMAAGEAAATKMLPEIRRQLSAVRNAGTAKEVL